MSSSIDFSTLAVGALVGMGCRKQLRSAARVAAVTAANLAGVATAAATQVAAETCSKEQAKDNGGKKMEIKYRGTPDELEYIIRMLKDIIKNKPEIHM